MSTADTIQSRSLAHISFSARWEDETGHHTALHHFEKFNVWRDLDLLPAAIADDILGQTVGIGSPHLFNAGELVEPFSSDNIRQIPTQNFSGRFANGQPIEPRVGRFYPQGMISGIEGIYSENRFPTRLIEQRDNHYRFDFNHPLSQAKMSLTPQIHAILPGQNEHGGRCNDVLLEMLRGPGMQLPYPGVATDYLSGEPFRRVDESSDSEFYRRDRLVHHLDATARQQLSRLYAELIPSQSQVVDLMASWESHLPQRLELAAVIGVGMNQHELDANPRLSERLVHDLNQHPLVPLPKSRFDAVICSASVEYLIDPVSVFSAVREILAPGGRFIVTFSNRWFPAKAIALWSEMHEFERPGLVIDYFRRAGWQGPINTLSLRGLSRPAGDPHYATTELSDPLFAIWSDKEAL
ncbi:methyltransferase domain-containing protein [Ectothiorhodospiraceae bacterium BW-2]|nr:methyltransferase domain-containing protein [Ectothiorhodospiraceae bacterium BW-2]